MRITSLFILSLLFPLLPQASALALDGRLQADAGRLTLALSDGRTLAGTALIGLTIVTGGPSEATTIRIDDVEESLRPAARELPLYRLSEQVEKGGPFTSYCTKDLLGRDAAFAIPGKDGQVDFTCTSGAEGKCILIGYRPWDTFREIQLKDMHSACVRMLRADYGGDGTSYTRDGTPVSFSDTLGIHRFSPEDGEMEFEAAWGPDGAICIAHARIPDLASLQVLSERYPHLAAKVGPAACSEKDAALSQRAILFNRSGTRTP